MESIQGMALVASPHLSDPNFLKSVVYILQHDAEGALGLVLNRPTSTNLGELLAQLDDTSICNQARVFCGGPVDGPLVMLQSVPVGQEVVIAVDSDQARILSVCQEESNVLEYRVFDGYSGWGPGQLDSELSQGGWLLWQVTPEDVFRDPDTVWQHAVKSIGREVLSGGIDPSKIPTDPAFN
jgi:putative transcriptional regulator